MLGVSILAARWAVRHVGIPPLWRRRLATGCIALGLMLLVEFSVVLWIRGMTIRGYFEARDPVMFKNPNQASIGGPEHGFVWNSV